MIQIEGSNARPADWCLTHYAITIPPKMFIPGVGTWVKQRNLVASIRVNAFDAVGLAQVATRTGPREIVVLKMSAARLGHYMLDMEGGSLERLVHATVFTTPRSPSLDMPLDTPPGHHGGLRPSTCSAWARTNASCSLSSTSVSNSARSESDKSPSVLRSIRCCNRSFALGGKRRSLTASTHSNGAETVASMTHSPCKKADPTLAPGRVMSIIPALRLGSQLRVRGLAGRPA
jgi:hypothetical protein